MTIPPILYHYTVGLKLKQIQSDGFLRTSPINPKPMERPVVWLSQNPYFDNSALKAIARSMNEASKLGTLREMTDLGGRVLRFAFSSSDIELTQPIYPWILLKNKARMPKAIVERLVKRAKLVNAKPGDWFGVLQPLPIHIAKIEILSDDLSKWTPFSQDDMTLIDQSTKAISLRDQQMPSHLRISDETWESS